MKQLKNFIDKTVTIKYPYEEDINKSNATEHMKKHSHSYVIIFHIVSKRRELRSLGMEICKCLQIFEWWCKVRTLNWSFWDCDTWIIPLLLSGIIPNWIPMGYSTVISIWHCTKWSLVLHHMLLHEISLLNGSFWIFILYTLCKCTRTWSFTLSRVPKRMYVKGYKSAAKDFLLSSQVSPDLQNEVLISLLETDPDVVDYLLRRKASQTSWVICFFIIPVSAGNFYLPLKVFKRF